MKPEPENSPEFESLRKLMALKRHEQPPPGYFDRLPKTIWTRLEKESMKESFWERIFSNWRLKPSVAYSFGLASCGVLLFGITVGLRQTPDQTVAQPIDNESWKFASPQIGAGIASHELDLSPVSEISYASTNPVNGNLPSLFDSMKLQVMPASYSPDNR